MARLILAALLFTLTGAAQDQQFKQAGVCARCHAIDERNAIKPERVSRAPRSLAAALDKNWLPGHYRWLEDEWRA